MTEFANPGPPSGDPFDFQSHVGRLLMVEVVGFEEHIPTVHTMPGEKSPAVRANVTVIDGLTPGEHFRETLIFPKVMQGQLKGKIGELVLGRLGQGIPKPGKNAAWELSAATEQDKAAATAWLAAHRQPVVTSAQPPF